MMLRSMLGLAVLLTFQPVLGQDFQKSYTLSQSVPVPPGAPLWGQPHGTPRQPMAPGGHIKIVINHVMGNLKVSGYDGKTVEVSAKRKGRDSEQIQIKDRSFGNLVELYMSYPPFHMGPSVVDCEVRVPKSVEYNLTLIVTGKIEISDLSGRLYARSDRGNVELNNVRGWVSASSTSGNLIVDISQTEERSNMRFSSISGNIKVSAPADFNALVDISSRSGFLKSDFPIDIQEARYGPGRLGRGKLGSGKQVLHITSQLGQVSLLQK